MRKAHVLRSLLALLLAALLTSALAGVAAAQEPTPDEVLTTLDRVQTQLQQMSSDVDAGAGPQRLIQDASGALALLLSVEESLAPLYADWQALRSQAESLYGEAGQAPPEALRRAIGTLQEGLARAREAAQRWKASGTTLTLEDVGAYPGEETWISLSLARVPEGRLESYDATISYSPEVLLVTKVTFTRGSGSWRADAAAGAVVIHGTGLKLGPTQQPQELAQVWLRVVGREAEMSVLSLRDLAVYDGSGARVPVTGAGGSVRVLAGEAPPTKSATVTPTPTPAPASARLLGLSPAYLYAIVAVLAVALLGVGLRFLLARR